MIDRVRDWGNIFTGSTGFGIAKAIASLGQVELITSNKQHIEEARTLGMDGRYFSDHASLIELLKERVTTQKYHAIFMTAAVSDYTPAGSYAVTERKTLPDGSEQWIVKNVQAGKVKSTHPSIAILGRPTKKIIDCFRAEWGYKGLLVKFKLEVGISREELLAIGKSSRVASAADYLIANTLEMVDGEKPGAFLISESGEKWIDRSQLPDECVNLVKSVL